MPVLTLKRPTWACLPALGICGSSSVPMNGATELLGTWYCPPSPTKTKSACQKHMEMHSTRETRGA